MHPCSYIVLYVDVRWFQLSNCDIGGDKGFQLLTPHLMRKNSIQVLILERLNLTDACAVNLSRIVKSQEVAMDTLFWNATLRINPPSAIEKISAVSESLNVDNMISSIQIGSWKDRISTPMNVRTSPTNSPIKPPVNSNIRKSIDSSNSLSGSVSASVSKGPGMWSAWVPKDDDNCITDVNTVYSSGLVAISINGNHLSENGLEAIFRGLKTNHWILALNIANNQVSSAGIVEYLLPSLRANNVLHTIVLAGNPGYSAALCREIKQFTDQCDCRFDVLKSESLQRLLYRWSIIQDRESNGSGVVVVDITKAQETVDLSSTTAWKLAAKLAAVSDDESESSAKKPTVDCRQYAVEPRPRWTVNTKASAMVHSNKSNESDLKVTSGQMLATSNVQARNNYMRQNEDEIVNDADYWQSRVHAESLLQSSIQDNVSTKKKFSLMDDELFNNLANEVELQLSRANSDEVDVLADALPTTSYVQSAGGFSDSPMESASPNGR